MKFTITELLILLKNDLFVIDKKSYLLFSSNSNNFNNVTGIYMMCLMQKYLDFNPIYIEKELNKEYKIKLTKQEFCRLCLIILVGKHIFTGYKAFSDMSKLFEKELCNKWNY